MTYIDHANEFIRDFSMYFEVLFHKRNFHTFDVRNFVYRYNTVKGKRMTFNSGASRAVIIGEDFVIKIDLPKSLLPQAGNSESEMRAWEFVRHSGFDYMFAPITKTFFKNHPLYIMPKVATLACENEGVSELYNVLSEDEYEFVSEYFTDIHDENFGFDEYGNVVIFDYAWNDIE
mgnify:CR=1 FL=1